MGRKGKRYAIGGGPCSGKTTSKAYLTQKFGDRGFDVLFAPEAATLIMETNFSPKKFDLRDFQTEVARTQLYFEDLLERAAARCANPLTFTDRGMPDIRHYCGSEAMFQEVLQTFGYKSMIDVREARYDGSYYLRTAAYGAEAFYTLANNANRLENTIEKARAACDGTMQCWNGYDKLRIVDNSTDFDSKMARLEQKICRDLGIPVPLEIERKFICKEVDFTRIPVPVQKIDIEQAYIAAPPPIVARVRKRGQNGAHLYYRTEKTHVRAGVNTEVESLISAHDYERALAKQLPETRIIKKHRHCFIYENQYFELDVIPMPDRVLYLLEIELTEETDTLNLPNFIKVVREVTDDPQYSNRALADEDWPLAFSV